MFNLVGLKMFKRDHQPVSLDFVTNSSAAIARSENWEWDYTHFMGWYLLNGRQHSVADDKVAGHVFKSQLDHTPNLSFTYKLHR